LLIVFYRTLGATVKTAKKQIGGNWKDFKAELKYKGKTVALHSAGNAYYFLVYAIVEYTHCDYLILTGKSQLISIKNLVHQISLNKNHRVIKKQTASDQDNQRVCNEIIAAIK
jgi:hypothetical protein